MPHAVCAQAVAANKQQKARPSTKFNLAERVAELQAAKTMAKPHPEAHADKKHSAQHALAA